MTPQQKQALQKYFAPNAVAEDDGDGAVYVHDTPDYVGDDRTWEITENGDVFLETGNEFDGYESELIYTGEE